MDQRNEISRLRYGQIAWAEIADRNGHRKTRPCIVITPTKRIDENAPLLVMAITTTFSDPPPPLHVPLPWNADPRRVSTRLARRSAAVVEWLSVIAPSDVIDVRGDVPLKLMVEIQRLLDVRAAKEDEKDKNEG